MLVLTRKVQQQLVIGDQIRITVVRIKGNTVRLGIEAPRSMRVVRAELPPSDAQSKPNPAGELPSHVDDSWKAAADAENSSHPPLNDVSDAAGEAYCLEPAIP